MLKLYNSRTHEIELFRPLSGNEVGLYACGPTVYNYAHIGNLRTYLFEDTLIRTLKHHGFTVKHVMNLTDVGHLTDDADFGEDKMEKGAKREGKTAWEIADFYAASFWQDTAELNILPPTIVARATAHIPEQIQFVQGLMDKGFTYTTKDGIYFDTSKFPDYGAMANIKMQQQIAGARVEMGDKKNPHDFALWKFSDPNEKRQMEWPAFGQMGFPGWHIECSAMAGKYLGEQFDIHCGGIDHVSTHHTNEIAQTEALTGKSPSVNFWLHGQFLSMQIGDKEEKMAKSQGEFITLSVVKEHHISPLAYRYFVLQAHYRKQLAFSWQALEAAEAGLKNLKRQIKLIDPKIQANHHLEKEFYDAIDDDLNTAEALGVLSIGLKEGTISLQTVIEFDKILGLNLHEIETAIELPPEVKKLLDQRALARQNKDWSESDRLRDEIIALGFGVEDTASGQSIIK